MSAPRVCSVHQLVRERGRHLNRLRTCAHKDLLRLGLQQAKSPALLQLALGLGRIVLANNLREHLSSASRMQAVGRTVR